jgi:hypothetical protein
MASIEVKGEVVTLLAYGTEIGVRTTQSAPPGARLEAMATDDDGTKSPFRIKVHRCRKQEDGAFIIMGATIDLRREGRAVLESLALSAPGVPRGT